MKYSEMKKNTLEMITLEYQDQEIKIKPYLSADDKYDLIMVTLQKAKEGAIYNPFKLSIYFHLNLVYLYTDIEFSLEDRMDEFAIYDELIKNGFMDKIIAAIPEDEYQLLHAAINETVKAELEYGTRVAASINKFIEEMPKAMEQIGEIIDNFDPEQYQNVINFATAANGGRSIFTNKEVEE